MENHYFGDELKELKKALTEKLPIFENEKLNLIYKLKLVDDKISKFKQNSWFWERWFGKDYKQLLNEYDVLNYNLGGANSIIYYCKNFIQNINLNPTGVVFEYHEISTLVYILSAEDSE